MDSIDWPALERLRAAFLDGTAGAADYWKTESDLASYDATFAQRIGWKWDYVLAQLERRDWTPPAGNIVDWGCGTGIAARRYLSRWEARRVFLSDRSTLAMQFAARRIRENNREQDLWSEPTPPPSTDVLLISHALTEQPEPWTLPCDAQAVIIVEPGTRDSARKLVALRESLRDTYNAVAPCTHNAPCGLAGNGRDWCHHFASPPTEVFMSADWARFAKLAGIDLRSLPVSYLVLDKRPLPALPAAAKRLIGAPRVYKAHALALLCGATGVREHRLTKRDSPAEFRRWKKRDAESLQLWRDGRLP